MQLSPFETSLPLLDKDNKRLELKKYSLRKKSTNKNEQCNIRILDDLEKVRTCHSCSKRTPIRPSSSHSFFLKYDIPQQFVYTKHLQRLVEWNPRH
jgi:hypothetical protein